MNTTRNWKSESGLKLRPQQRTSENGEIGERLFSTLISNTILEISKIFALKFSFCHLPSAWFAYALEIFANSYVVIL